MELGKLTAVFDADTKRFDAGLRGVQAKLSLVSKDLGKTTLSTNQLTSATGPASSGLSVMGGALGIATGAAIGTAAAIGAATAGIYKLATFSQQLGAEIFDLSQKINFSAETLSSLKVAAELSGGSLASLSTSLGIFDRNMEEANDSSSEMSKIFKILKIDTLDNEKALRQAFTSLAAMGSGAQQTAIAMKLFGRSGKEVLGIVKETGGNVDDFIQKMKDLGLTITTDGAKKADKFGDELTILQGKLEAIARQIGQELVPTVSKAADDISRWLKENQSEIIKTAKDLAALVGWVYELAKVAASPIVIQIKIVRWIVDQLPSGADIMSGIGSSVARGLGATDDAMRRAARITTPWRDESEYVTPGSTVPAGPPMPGRINLPGGGGGGGGGRAKRTKSPGQDFDEYYNLFDYFKKVEEERVENNKRIADEMERQKDRMYDILNSMLQMNQEAMEFGPVATATGDLEKFMEIEPPEDTFTQAMAEADRQMREAMMNLGEDITSVFANAVGDGFELGAKRGLVTLAQGMLRIVEDIFLKRLAEGLGNILSDLALGSGGGSGFWGGLAKAIGGAVLGGAAGGATGGLTGGFAGGNSGGVGSGIGNFAKGGYLKPGQWGTVGEAGPERVYGGLSGMSVIPNSGQVVNNHYTINLPPSPKGGYTSPKSQRELGDKLLAMLQGSQA